MDCEDNQAFLKEGRKAGAIISHACTILKQFSKAEQESTKSLLLEKASLDAENPPASALDAGFSVIGQEHHWKVNERLIMVSDITNKIPGQLHTA